MIVWHEMARDRVKGKETSKVTFQELDPGIGHAIGQPVIQNLKVNSSDKETLNI